MEQSANRPSNRDPALDAVRALAIFMVLIIHASSASLFLPMDHASWWTGLFWAFVARPAVPLFFLCSGALLLGRDIPLRRLFGHNLLRILVAMFIWAFGYQLLAHFQTGDLFSPAGLLAALKETVLFRHEFHFYYLHILILVYCFLPVARTFLRRATRREEEYALLFWAVTGIALPLLGQFKPFSLIYAVGQYYTMNQAYSAIGYCILGHYLRQYGSTIHRRWFALALVLGFSICFGGTALASLLSGRFSGLFQEGMSPGPALMAFGIMGLALTVPRWDSHLAAFMGRLAQASFCIYLAHVAFQKVLFALGYNNTILSVFTIPGMALILLLCSWMVYEILRRIPIVRKWLI